MTNTGIINRLVGGTKVLNKEDEKTIEKIQDKLITVDKCNNINVSLKLDAFSQWLIKFLKRDDKKSMDIKTKVRYYIDKDVNNKGTHISDFDIIVDNESMPFTSLDQVDYFLKNYIDNVNNHRLDDSDAKKKDDSYYFQNIEKTIPFYPVRKQNIYNSPPGQGLVYSQGGNIKKHNQTKSKGNKTKSKINKKHKKSRKNTKK